MINARLRPQTTIDALDSAQRRLRAARSEFLALVADADREQLWKRDGATSMSAWLTARYGEGWGTARETVRVAHALNELPAIAEAHAQSKLSWDQLKPVTRFATPDSDEFWAGRAGRLRPKTLYREAERHRMVQESQVEDLRRLRHLSSWWDPVGMLNLRGALAPEEGAAFEAAINSRVEVIGKEQGPDPDTGDTRAADALVELVTGDAPKPATVVVHADAEVLTGETSGDGPVLSETSGGQRLSTEQVRRLACDQKIEWILERAGRPVGLGRQVRLMTGQMLRALRHRDPVCRFPGCERDRWLKAHHIVHWANGGRTDLENMMMLCHDHHRLLHEGGWRVRGSPHEELEFRDPHGRVPGTALGSLERASPNG